MRGSKVQEDPQPEGRRPEAPPHFRPLSPQNTRSPIQRRKFRSGRYDPCGILPPRVRSGLRKYPHRVLCSFSPELLSFSASAPPADPHTTPVHDPEVLRSSSSFIPPSVCPAFPALRRVCGLQGHPPAPALRQMYPPARRGRT